MEPEVCDDVTDVGYDGFKEENGDEVSNDGDDDMEEEDGDEVSNVGDDDVEGEQMMSGIMVMMKWKGAT